MDDHAITTRESKRRRPWQEPTMSVRNVITMCHFNRPDYSRQVIEALRVCEGIGDYLILPHVEPGNDAVRGS